MSLVRVPVLLSLTVEELRDLRSGYDDGTAHICHPSDVQEIVMAKLDAALAAVTDDV